MARCSIDGDVGRAGVSVNRERTRRWRKNALSLSYLDGDEQIRLINLSRQDQARLQRLGVLANEFARP
jgi:hypothetical protein